jgi:hypothetical protein
MKSKVYMVIEEESGKYLGCFATLDAAKECANNSYFLTDIIAEELLVSAS